MVSVSLDSYVTSRLQLLYLYLKSRPSSSSQWRKIDESLILYVTKICVLSRATSTNRTHEATLTVSIIDVNDEVPVIAGSFTASIEEGQPSGTVVPTAFNASDADENDALTFSISGSYFCFAFCP